MTRVNPARPEYLELQPDSDWFARFDFPPHGLKPTLLAIKAIEEALKDAGLSFAQLRSKRVGICLGTTLGGTNYHGEFNRAYFKGEKPDAGPLFEYLKSNSAQWIARRFDWRGPVLLVNNACTSGADAIGIGRGWLDADLCDIAICGGTEAIVPKIYYGFRALQLCAPTLCAPFDRDRQGLRSVKALVSCCSSRTIRRARRKHACSATAQRATLFIRLRHIPKGGGLEIAVRHATRDFRTRLRRFHQRSWNGDTAQRSRRGAMDRSALSARSRTIATKGYTGHTLGAAGALEAVFHHSLSRKVVNCRRSRGFLTMDPEIRRLTEPPRRKPVTTESHCRSHSASAASTRCWRWGKRHDDSYCRSRPSLRTRARRAGLAPGA